MEMIEGMMTQDSRQEGMEDLREGRNEGGDRSGLEMGWKRKEKWKEGNATTRRARG